MRNLLRVIITALTLATCTARAAQEEQTRLLRFPTTNGKQVVFVYAGQLYTADINGGVARRLTDAPGYVTFPRFSADGTKLAFTAQYDGNTEIYTMPAEGGVPKRLTYTATLKRDDVSDRMGPNNIVMAWKNTRDEIVYRSRAISFNDFVGQLFSVGVNAEVPTQLPVPRGGFVSFSPDDKAMAYNQVFREFRTWKAYKGGMADDIWIYHYDTGTTENITNNDAQDVFPMWAPNGRIYYGSDRDGRMNLFVYDPATKATTQLTHYKDFDIKFPSLGGGVIAYEQAGYLHVFDTATGNDRNVPITIHEDFASARGGPANVSDLLTTLDLSPDGKRVVVSARGDLFTVPAKNGATRNLTQTSGIQERAATWSPDGKWIAYISDATGEDELYVRSQDGKADPIQVTSGSSNYFFNVVWSPDSTKLLWADRDQNLSYVEAATKKVTVIEKNTVIEFHDYVWSPDSRWVAYVRPYSRGMNRLALYSLETKTSTDVSSPWFSVDTPRFSRDGKFLLFSSNRDFNPIFSDTEWNHAYQNMQRIFLVPLSKNTPSPLAPKSDEVNTEVVAEKTDDKKPEATKPVQVSVDFEGIQDRVIGLPIAAANYSTVAMIGDKVYYIRSVSGPVKSAHDEEPRTTINAAFYDLAERKETDLGTVSAFDISQDGKKALVAVDKDFAIIDTPSAKIEIKDKLDFSGVEANVNLTEEWSGIYAATWRQMRDFFYDPAMHGVDWAAQRAKYAALLPYVKSRYDLTYVLGELVGELHIGHAYVGGGLRPPLNRIQTGLLGAKVSRDPASKAYRIDHLLRGENWQDGTHSPLTEPGLDVREGDYILAVNGKPVSKLENLYSALVGTAGKQVVLRVSRTPSNDSARDITVVPIADEAPLYYSEWVHRNIEIVSKATDGQVGYLHIPDMGVEGLNQFVKYFYPQLSKKALIIDDRGNGGGNVSPMIIERLRRELAFIEHNRNGEPLTSPTEMVTGPLTLLINEYSASDGDLFPFRFRAHKLGTIIGKRTWGGVVGIRGPQPLFDGGFVMKPEFGPYAKDGSKWIIEGHGVEPDITVSNDPKKEFEGDDQQLDKAIEVTLEALKTKAVTLPTPPPFPVKR